MNSSSEIARRTSLVLAVLATVAASAATVFPDYFNIEVPPNIAPLNFDVTDIAPTTRVDVVWRAANGDELAAQGPKVRFSARAWRAFLEKHAGESVVGSLRMGADVFSFTNRVSKFPIDSHLTYRLIPPGYTGFSEVGIYQRCLENFSERPLYRNVQSSRVQCVNCHTYNAADPSQYLFHTRAYEAGTVVVSPKYGKQRIKPEIPGGYKFGVYPAWHPSGDYVAFSCNDTSQIFYVTNPDKIEVMDSRSDMMLYSLKDGKVTMIEDDPTLFECFPTWSPDGKYLVSSSARTPFKSLPPDKAGRERQMQEKYSQVSYDLVVRTFDEKTGTFSPRRLLVNALTSKRSFTFPRISPDGRWLVFTVGPYGVFHIWHKSADLWVLDIQKNTARALNEINSSESDSYHCFSRSGRWMVFSSRRDDGVYTRPYFTALDPATGHFSKPFILPVENPADHTHRMLSYNIPELSAGPVRESPRELRKLVESEPRK